MGAQWYCDKGCRDEGGKKMNSMTVEEYKRKSRGMETSDARKGLIVHAVIVAGVSTLLAVINVTLVPQFLWCVFPAAGMTAGVIVHYLFGFRRLDRSLEQKELRVEQWR
jgi:hypothetical protein